MKEKSAVARSMNAKVIRIGAPSKFHLLAHLIVRTTRLNLKRTCIVHALTFESREWEEVIKSCVHNVFVELASICSLHHSHTHSPANSYYSYSIYANTKISVRNCVVCYSSGKNSRETIYKFTEFVSIHFVSNNQQVGYNDNN